MNKNEQVKESAELPKLCEIREQESDAQIQNRRSMTERFVDSAPEAPIRSVKYIHKHGISRYNNALHNLIPIQRAETPPQSKESMSIDNVGLFSFLYSTWLTKYLWAAYRKEIAPSNLPTVSKFDSCAYNVQRLEILWNDELSKQGSEAASFPLVVWRFVRTRVLVSCFLIFCSEVIGFSSNTLIIRRVLEHIGKSEESFWSGLKWVIGLGVLDLIRALLFSWSWLVNYRTAIRLKAACLTLLYRKIINLNTLGGKSAGELINIFSNDGQRASDVIVYGPMIVGGPIITVCAVICILSWLSPIALLGIVIFLLFYPVQYAISRVFSYCRRKTIKIADTRIERTIEILDCIKLIKMYAWEKHFSDDILRIRNKERSWLWKMAYTSSFGSALTPAVPIMSIIVTFLVHLSMGNNLTAAVSVLLLQDTSTEIIKPIIRSQALAIVNGKFVCEIYDKRENNNNTKKTKKKLQKDSNATEFERAQLDQKPSDTTRQLEILSDITFEASKGKLIGICGHFGSGKSSLLIAALGQLRMTAGQLMRDGSCAYVNQQAWIINATLKENILFGEAFDSKRYYRTLLICSLNEDTDMLPGGDETEIGERGVNLSGGQKQRVALARAYYSNRDIYFLDDPLSAVDENVGLKIFKNLILDGLADKTVLMVTHQIKFLNRCDDIYLLRSGRIIEHGSHNELMRLDKEYTSMIKNSIINRRKHGLIQNPQDGLLDNETDSLDKPSETSTDSIEKEKKSLLWGTTREDKIGHGKLKKNAYHAYIMAAGGYFMIFFIFMVFIFYTGIGVFSSWWLALWLEAGSGNTTVQVGNETVVSENINDNPNFTYYQSIYGSCILLIILICVIRGLVLRSATMNASINLHCSLLNKLINAPLKFFDTTPPGRIQNLVSRDMDEVDVRLPMTLESAMQCLFLCIFTFLTVVCSLPWFLIPGIFLSLLFFYVGKVYRAGLTNLKRLENMLRSPVYGFVTISAQGLSTIRAFKKEKEFVHKFQELLDRNNACYFMCDVAMRWLSSRFDTLATVCTCVVAFLVILTKDQISPAIAGLALAYAVQMSGTFQYGIRMLSDVEVRFVSVERICHYLEKLIGESDNKEISIVPLSDWPTAGKIQFEDVELKYSKESQIVLNDISFTIDSGEKIGIVGRTGSGKSSLVIALYRLYELSKGRILIDDIDVSKVELQLLRNRLTIIPQDLILFSGSVRFYLDRTKSYSDSDIWNALERTHLREKILSASLQLDSPIEMGGENFSMGERQLLSLTRALLRHSKILVLDEATASVDPDTEAAVHQIINEEFSNSTVLIIAHRLQTIMSCNRIMVIDKGEIVEFDSPSDLLNNENSKFSTMFAIAEETVRNY